MILLEKIDNLFTSEKFDTSEIENGKNDIIKYKHMIVTLTSTKNQKNDEKNGNVTTINLGDCERLLREAYNISVNETLFMKKIDVIEEWMMIPKIEFDVYYKLQIDKKDIDKYNSSSGYYNDICYVTISDGGTDITLKDRKSEFIDNNRTICQDSCFFLILIIILIKLNVHVMLLNLQLILMILQLIKQKYMKI